MQRDHLYCIVDEVDSILVDEARTPLIISGPAPIEREQPFTRHQALGRGAGRTRRPASATGWSPRRGSSSKSPTATDRRPATCALRRKMLQVKMGSPKNKQLLRLMETPEWRKQLDKVETEMNSDLNKDELYHLKEELFYVDRRAPAPGRPDRDRAHQAPPGQPGRVHDARPGHGVQRPREEPRSHAGGEGEAPDRGPAAVRGRQRGHPRDQPAAARLFALRARRRVRRPGRQGDDRRREHRAASCRAGAGPTASTRRSRPRRA